VKAEIYAIGMFFFHFVFRQFPFETNAGKDPEAKTTDFLYRFETSERNKFKIKTSQNFLHMLAKMLAFEPNDRASIDEIMSSRWYLEQHHYLSRDTQANKTLPNPLSLKLTMSKT